MENQSNIRYILMTVFTSIAFYFLIDMERKISAEEFDFTSIELRETANQYLDIPYSWGGTTTTGFDCSGFVLKVFADLGIALPRTSSVQYQVGESVAKTELQPGDLVFFNTLGNGVSHVGIYYGDGKFIHSQSVKGVSITDINDPQYWGGRYIGAKRIANVQEVLKTTSGSITESAS